MPNQLQLILFGSPVVRLHGQPVTGFRTSKAQALLYYLAVTGRPHTRATSPVCSGAINPKTRPAPV